MSVVRMLLSIVKHSRPDIANATRELSKANDGANPAAFWELLSVIGFYLTPKNLLKVRAEQGCKQTLGN